MNTVNTLVGKRITMVSMTDPYPIESGSQGTINHIGGGVINVNWDDGRTLGVVEDVDQYTIEN